MLLSLQLIGQFNCSIVSFSFSFSFSKVVRFYLHQRVWLRHLKNTEYTSEMSLGVKVVFSYNLFMIFLFEISSRLISRSNHSDTMYEVIRWEKKKFRNRTFRNEEKCLCFHRNCSNKRSFGHCFNRSESMQRQKWWNIFLKRKLIDLLLGIIRGKTHNYRSNRNMKYFVLTFDDRLKNDWIP